MTCSKKEILAALAPCGLDCSRCVQYAASDVKRLSEELTQRLVGFDKFAARVSAHVPALKSYPAFLEVLDYFRQASCMGCRNGAACFPLCSAKNCHREKGVDFCFQCDEYPCSRNQYPAELAQRWRTYNDRMKEIGIEAFYQEQLSCPRY